MYATVTDMIAANGDRHVALALNHFADGKPEHARGSLAKALRNYVRAIEAGALFATDHAAIEGLAAWRLKAEVKRQRTVAGQQCAIRLQPDMGRTLMRHTDF